VLRKTFIIIFLVALLCLSGIYETAVQGQPPFIPHIVYGTAHVDGAPLDKYDTGYTVSMRMDRLVLIFLDDWDSQALIITILGELDAGATSALQQAFDESAYCQSRGLTLSAGASAIAETPGSEWRVYDGGRTYTVIIQDIDVWDGFVWTAGYKMEVYEHNGVITSYAMGSYDFIDEYVLEVPMSSGLVYGGRSPNTYVIREPGKAITGEPANIEINGITITDPPLPYPVGEEAFVGMDINAPSTYDFTITLEVGWNLISFPINYCFYQDGSMPTDQPACVELVNISDLGYAYMADWFDSILTSQNQVEPAWEIVRSATTSMDSSFLAIAHSLKYMSPCGGYWVKISEAAGDTELSLSGSLFDPNCVIPLKDGWNLVGYPLTIVYYDTDSPPAIDVPDGTTWIKVAAPTPGYVFGSIDGYYSVVVGERYSYDPAFPPEGNSLRYMEPGSAYWIKVSGDRSLVYP